MRVMQLDVWDGETDVITEKQFYHHARIEYFSYSGKWGLFEKNKINVATSNIL